jgi:hypothetical protein
MKSGLVAVKSLGNERVILGKNYLDRVCVCVLHICDSCVDFVCGVASLLDAAMG